MARLVNVTSGAATKRFGFEATDLGYLVPTRHGYSMAIFGDTFDTKVGSPGWRSPVILRTSNRDLANGLKWDNAVGGQRAKQVFDYQHIGDRGTVNGKNHDCFTIIPNDIIHLPDGRYMASGFRVIRWGSEGDQSMCWTLSNAFFYSDEPHGEVWYPARTVGDLGRVYEWPKTDPIGFKFQNVSMIMTDPTGESDPYVYIFGTPEGRHTGPAAGIYLRRVHWAKMWDNSAYEQWGFVGGAWKWGADVVPTPILKPSIKGQTIGEINAQVIEGRVVLAYCDGMIGAVTRVATRPDAVWTDPQLHANHIIAPAMYAPSIHPYSTLDAPYMHLSQWHENHPIAGTFYGTKFWAIDPLPKVKIVNNVPDPVGDVGAVADTDSVEGTSAPVADNLQSLSIDALVDILTSESHIDAGDLLEELKSRGV